VIDPALLAIGSFLRAVLEGRLPDPMDVAGLGLAQEIEAAYSLLEASPTARIRADLAQRGTLPYSEVRERWSDQDLAMVIAHRAWTAAREEDRCPKCGTHPDDVTDPVTLRPLRFGAVKVSVEGCLMCGELSKAADDLSDEERRAGVAPRLRRREWGDPLVDTREPGRG
jgi:hypothetical protein